MARYRRRDEDDDYEDDRPAPKRRSSAGLLMVAAAFALGLPILACGGCFMLGVSNVKKVPRPEVANEPNLQVAEVREEPANSVPALPKRPGIGDTVTLTNKSRTVPVAKDHAGLVEWQQAKDDFARSVAEAKGIKKVASGTEAVIVSETSETFTVRFTSGIYKDTTGVIAANSALEEYNQKVKEREAVLAQLAARAKEQAEQDEKNRPYQFVARKAEPFGNPPRRCVMDLYAFSGTLDEAKLEAFCRERKGDSPAEAFYYVVIFDKSENAKFPTTPFTAEFGGDDDEAASKHIRVIYCYNKINGFSEVRFHHQNVYDHVTKRKRI